MFKQHEVVHSSPFIVSHTFAQIPIRIASKELAAEAEIVSNAGTNTAKTL